MMALKLQNLVNHWIYKVFTLFDKCCSDRDRIRTYVRLLRRQIVSLMIIYQNLALPLYLQQLQRFLNIFHFALFSSILVKYSAYLVFLCNFCARFVLNKIAVNTIIKDFLKFSFLIFNIFCAIFYTFVVTYTIYPIFLK